MIEDSFSGLARKAAAVGRRVVAAHAAREADPAAVGVDHATIAAREGEERHQAVGQGRLDEVGLECEQVRGTRQGRSSCVGNRPGSQEPCAAMTTEARSQRCSCPRIRQ